MAEERETLKLVVAGHVDHGKSTVIGRLLHDTNSLPRGTVDKVRRIARESGKDFEFAYLLDALEEEQKQGITIDVAKLRFRTARRDYLIIDAPGHKEFLKNMISGATDAEAAFLVIDAARGVEEQSRRHACMLSLLGIRRICVLVNKMDLVGYDRDVFLRVREEMDAFLSSLGLAALEAIPLSALRGDNILRPSGKLSWHQGRSLLELLDSLGGEEIPAGGRLPEERLRLPVQDVYKFDDRRIIAGRLESGVLRVGDEILILPGGGRTRVAALACWLEKDRRTEALPGESVGLLLADEFFHQRGEILCRPDAPPLLTRSFRASLFWMGKNPLRQGRTYRLKISTQAVDAEVEDITRVMDASSLAVAEGAREAGLNDVAEVLLSTREPVVLDPFSVCRATGRFVLVEGFDVAGGGIVTEVADREEFFGFVQGEIRARCELFEEYYYSVEDRAVNKRRARAAVYGVGDAVPLEGRSFSYPEFFDVVVLRDRVAVRIRGGQVAQMLPLEEYRYEGLPVLNGRGFAFRVRSRAQWRACMEAFASVGDAGAEAEASLAWLDFTAYRDIPFSRNHWDI
jgi:sulfate adenylyltransferase large subunit